MNIYNYGFREGSRFWSMGHQIRHDINHLRIDLKNSIDTQTQTQTRDAELMRTNQTTLVGKMIEAVKMIFTGKSPSGTDESFYKMVQRENDETQQFMATHTQTTSDRLNSVINSLTTISNDVQANTSGDSTNANLISQAIRNLRLIVNT